MAFITLTANNDGKIRININHLIMYGRPHPSIHKAGSEWRSALTVTDPSSKDGIEFVTETPEEIDAIIRSAIILEGEWTQPTPDQDDRRKGFPA